jgi:hypothetical protein
MKGLDRKGEIKKQQNSPFHDKLSESVKQNTPWSNPNTEEMHG